MPLDPGLNSPESRQGKDELQEDPWKPIFSGDFQSISKRYPLFPPEKTSPKSRDTGVEVGVSRPPKTSMVLSLSCRAMIKS